MPKFLRAFPAAAVCAVLLAGCSSSQMRYNLFDRPSSYGYTTNKSRPNVVVNPIVFEGIPNPEPWQKEIGTKLQNEFANSIFRTNLLSPTVSPTPVRDSMDDFVLHVTIRDSCVEHPVWYVFVMGEKQTYVLNSDIRITRKGATVASFKYSQSKTGYERLFGSYMLIPLFPVGSPAKDVVVNDLMAKLFNEFEMFLVHNQDALAGTAPKKDTTSRAQPVRSTFSNTLWQEHRREYVGRYRLSPMMAAGIDVSENTGLEKIDNFSTSVSGPAYGFEVSMDPLLTSDGIQVGSPSVSPELWARFLHLRTTTDVYLVDEGDVNQRTLISRDEGGETHMSVLAGARVVFRTMEMYRLFLQMGIGTTWGSQDGDIVPLDKEDYPDVDYFVRREDADYKNTMQMLYGGGLRIGHPRDQISYDLSFNVHSASDRDQVILLPMFAFRVKL